MLLGFTVHGCFFCLLCAAHSCDSLIKPGVPTCYALYEHMVRDSSWPETFTI